MPPAVPASTARGPRQLTQGFFKRLYIGHQGQVIRAELTEALGLLLADDLLDKVEAERRTDRGHDAEPRIWDQPGVWYDEGSDPSGSDPYVVDVAVVHGSNDRTSVGHQGLEP